MKKLNNGVLADMSMLITAIFWGGGFIAVKDALDSVKPFHLMAIRFAFAALILGLIFHKRMRKMRLKDMRAGFIVGIFLFLGFVAQTIGLQYTTAGKNAFLTGLNVVMVPFFYWFIKRKNPGWHSFIAAILSLAGIGLLTLQNGALAINLGDLLTIICAVFFAVHIIAVGHFTEGMDAIVLAIVQMAVAAILSMICATIFEPFMPLSAINSNNIFSLSYLILFSTMLAFLIQNAAQKYTVPTHAAIILCMESVFGSIFSVLFLGDVFSPTMILGCSVIFFAIILSETKFSFLRVFKNSKNSADESKAI